MQRFIGRQEELLVLEREYAKSSSFVVLYGRRRVGKTTLIKEFIKNKHALYFLATEEHETRSMQNFATSLVSFTKQSYLKSVSFSNWEAMFQIFADCEPDQKKILIIDEFQYLVQTNPAFPSIFQRIWDEILANKNVMVILCGSFIRMMTSHTLAYDSPLYGRRTAQIKLQPLKFTEIAAEYPHRPFADLVEEYAVTGGIPKYFEFFQNENALMKNIQRNVLSKSAFLYEEPLFLLANEVREPLGYFSLLRTISEGRHRLSEIATVLERSSSSLGPYLHTLIELNLIERRVPVTEKTPEKSRKGLYFIADNFINFWFSYVHPYRGELELDNQQIVLDKLQASFIETFVSYRYEDMCKNIFSSLCREQKLSFTPSKIGSYWNGNHSIEIDVVAVDHSRNLIFAAECKYLRENPVGISVYSNLVQKCKTPDFQGYDIIYGLFSKTGFEPRLLELARNNKNVVLIHENSVLSS